MTELRYSTRFLQKVMVKQLRDKLDRAYELFGPFNDPDEFGAFVDAAQEAVLGWLPPDHAARSNKTWEVTFEE